MTDRLNYQKAFMTAWIKERVYEGLDYKICADGRDY